MDKYISESVNREQQKSDIFMREVKEIIDETDKKIERLRRALEKYGLHEEGCGVECEINQGVISEYCTCGLSQALKER